MERLAAHAAARGVRPDIVWHSGKLRARQTAEVFWRACNALASCAATRDLQPSDSPAWMRDRLLDESQDILIVGHFPHLPALLALLLDRVDDAREGFPLHGIVALSTEDQGKTWTEEWRAGSEAAPETSTRD